MAINKQNNRHTKPPQTHIAFIMPRPKIIGSCHKSVTEKIRGGNERLLVITGALIASKITQRAISFCHRWYLFLPHWIIQSSIHLSCPWFVNSHPDLHWTLLVITGASIERTVTQRTMSCHHQWYLCLLHWMIQSLIHLSCPRLFNSHLAQHRTQCQIHKLLQYLLGLHLIRQILCHRRPPRTEVPIFMD